tara:strand:- start:10088 stop:10390 length:303 start_codon:yes stop_codon:yes gene_type:complete
VSFNSFSDFYKFYLSEHSKAGTKIFHFIGTALVFVSLFLYFYTYDSLYLFFAPLMGYGFAWFSHIFIEKNTPATFKYPLYSLKADFVMFFHILKGKIKIF